MKLVLFSRKNCHLCDAFEDELKELLQNMNQDYQKIDVDSQQELQTRYGNDVPVLAFNNTIICQHFFDKDKTLEVLN